MGPLAGLVPLDGSRLSEQAFMLLPLLRQLGFERVILLRVAPAGDPEAEAEARDYLQACAERIEAFDFETDIDARSGAPAKQILRAARDHAVDLILIATHGRSGLERLRLGSVADEVVRKASCPTLLLGPNVKVGLSPYTLRRILVPLDGTRLAEAALPVAAHLADRAGAGLDLVQVVPFVEPTAVWGYPMDASVEQRKAVLPYLEGLGQRVSQDVPIHTEVRFGEAGEQLLAYAGRTELVVLVSHTRSGLARSVLGSVADQLLRGPAPVLVLKPGVDAGRLSRASESSTRYAR